jgi:membrane protein DedA with SNARE-associated domain
MQKTFSLFKAIITHDLLLPVIMLTVYIAFFFFAKGTIPTGEELVALFREVYREYGYLIIFCAALLESLVLINFLIPGSLALALGAVFAKSGELDLTTVVLIASCGAIIGYITDYLLGYAGLDRLLKKLGYAKVLSEIEKRVNKKIFALGFINPTLGSFFSLSAGIINSSFPTFLIIAVLSTLVWFSLWGILFYTVGEVLLEIVSKYFGLVFIITFGSTMLFQLVKKKN